MLDSKQAAPEFWILSLIIKKKKDLGLSDAKCDLRSSERV